jgi:hypothetical protein
VTQPIGFKFLAIASDAWSVFNDGCLLANDSVEECAFTDIRSAHNDCNWELNF